jgi:hypothetical protein
MLTALLYVHHAHVVLVFTFHGTSGCDEVLFVEVVMLSGLLPLHV